MNRSFALVVLGVTFAGYALAGDARHFTLPELSGYYQSQSRGAIEAHPFYLDSSKFKFTFHPQKEFPYAFVSDTTYEMGSLQHLFTFDVAKFNEQMGARDLVEAKTKYYSKLAYFPAGQSHQRPYYYLEDWGQLFHPPIMELTLPHGAYYSGFPDDFEPRNEDRSLFFNPAFQKGIDQETGTGLTYGNELELLSNGKAFHAKLDLVRRAKKTLWISIMMFACDTTGKQLLKEILARVKAGVDVRVITEGFYADTFARSCASKMLNGGVKLVTNNVATYMSTFGMVNHQKVWLRDGEEMILGGENILDYENEGNGFNGYNRDGDLRVKGPAVTDAMYSYLREFTHFAIDTKFAEENPVTAYAGWIAENRTRELRQDIRGQGNYDAWLGKRETRMNGICRVAMQSMQWKQQPIEPILERMLMASTKQVIMTTPDFSPNPDEVAAGKDRISHFVRRILKGDKVADPEIIIISNGLGGGAGELSMWLKNRMIELRNTGANLFKIVARGVIAALHHKYSTGASHDNREHMMRLQQLNPKIKAYTYFQYIHAKHFLFDRLATFVGSWNIDNNSGDKNLEAGIVCLDDSLRKQMEKQLTQDLANSIPVVSSNKK